MVAAATTEASTCVDEPRSRESGSMLRRAFEILDTFSESDRTLSIREIARRCDLPKSTAHRLVSELVELGAVTRVEGGYRIGLGMFRLGMLSMDARYFDASFPYLRHLHAVSRRTVHLATLRGDQSMYLDKLVGGNSPTTPALIGGTLPAWRTAVGKILLAHRDPNGYLLDAERLAAPSTTFGAPVSLAENLRRIRRAGVAIERDEVAPGVACLAAPLFRGADIVGAIAVVMHSDEPAPVELIAPLRQTAAAVSKALTVIG